MTFPSRLPICRPDDKTVRTSADQNKHAAICLQFSWNENLADRMILRTSNNNVFDWDPFRSRTGEQAIFKVIRHFPALIFTKAKTHHGWSALLLFKLSLRADWKTWSLKKVKVFTISMSHDSGLQFFFKVKLLKEENGTSQLPGRDKTQRCWHKCGQRSLGMDTWASRNTWQTARWTKWTEWTEWSCHNFSALEHLSNLSSRWGVDK